MHPDDLKKLFELAKIEPTQEELEKLPREIDSILQYVKILQSADLSGISPIVSISRHPSSFRQDEQKDSGSKAKDAFPESSGDYLKSKGVFENS